MSERFPKWDETYQGHEAVWRSGIRGLIVSLMILIAAVAGAIIMKLKPEWLEFIFYFIALCAVIFIPAQIQALNEIRRDKAYWWLNRPYKWWQ